MTQEIKSKLEQAAETAWEQDQKTNPSPVNPHAYVYGYKAGAQTVLENPIEWGLCSLEALQGINKLKAENGRYREAMKKASDFAFHLSEPVYEIVDILEEAIDGRE